MENVSSNASTISTQLSNVTIGIGTLVCMWIIISHCVILLCFFRNRGKPWINQSILILSLSLNDALLGVMILLLLFAQSEIYYVTCVFIAYPLIALQNSSLYHVTCICICRAKILFKRSIDSVQLKMKEIVIITFSAWITSFIICALPFILWMEDKGDVPNCVLQPLFVQHYERVMGFYAFCYIVPLLFTNVVYLFTVFKLVAVTKKIYPLESTAIAIPTADLNIERSGRPWLKAHRVTIVTIGMLLLLFNVFTATFVVMLFLVYFDIFPPSYDLKITTLYVYMLNSVASPFVYTSRSRFLNKALKHFIRYDVLGCKRSVL